MRAVVTGPTSFIQRYGELSAQMQRLFKAWGPYDTADHTDKYADPFDLPYLRKFQEDIVEKQYPKDELAAKLFDYLGILEKVAAEIFRLVSNQALGTPIDMAVDPYTMSLTGEKRESVNSKLLERDAEIAKQLKPMWLYPYPAEVAV